MGYLAIKSDPMSFLQKMLEERGEFARFRVLGFPYLLINDPKVIREALVEKPNQLVIQGGTSAGLARLIGHGILTNRGAQWQKSRSSLQPMFQQNALDKQFPIMKLRAGESIDRWKSQFANRNFSLNQELLAMSFRMMSSSLFGYLPSFLEAQNFADAICVLQLDGMKRYMSGGDYFSWLPTALNRKVNQAKLTIKNLAIKIVEHGASQPLDEILSVLFAGTESVVNSLCWTFKLLQDNPEWLEKLRATTTIEQPEAFDLASQIISETLRLYPAGWAFERYAVEDVTLGGQPIAKGTRLLFSPYLLHRQAHYWQDPEKFGPQRFATSSKSAEGVPKFAYLPFGAGPRSCLGARYAWAEMRMILALVVQQFDWQFVKSDNEDELKALGSFKIRFNRPVTVRMFERTPHGI